MAFSKSDKNGTVDGIKQVTEVTECKVKTLESREAMEQRQIKRLVLKLIVGGCEYIKREVDYVATGSVTTVYPFPVAAITARIIMTP